VSLSVAVLGPGGVGGFVAAALARTGTAVTVVAGEDTAAHIARAGLRVESVRLGSFMVRPSAVATLDEAVDVLVVAAKAPSLAAALARVRGEPGIVVPLLNGIDHLALLHERFGARVVAGTIRIAADRTEPGHIVHTSPSVRIEMAPPLPEVARFGDALRTAEIPTRIRASPADVIWSKLVRLNALATTTAAADRPIGAVRTHPLWRARLQGVVDETAAVAAAEGAAIDPDAVLIELEDVPAGQTSSLQRDLAAGRESELDAIPGAVLRHAWMHGIPTPAIEELMALIRERYPAA
jgi:2-dehydropantoate 2-reductase